VLETVVVIVMHVADEIAVVSTVVQRLELGMLLEKHSLFLLLEPQALSFDLPRSLLSLHESLVDLGLLLGRNLLLMPDLHELLLQLSLLVFFLALSLLLFLSGRFCLLLSPGESLRAVHLGWVVVQFYLLIFFLLLLGLVFGHCEHLVLPGLALFLEVLFPLLGCHSQHGLSVGGAKILHRVLFLLL